jgi:hypothetical protein
MPDEDVHHKVHSWLMWLDMDFFCSGMGNYVKRGNKNLNKYGDYVEKQLTYTFPPLYFHFLLIKHFRGKKSVTLLFGQPLYTKITFKNFCKCKLKYYTHGLIYTYVNQCATLSFRLLL